MTDYYTQTVIHQKIPERLIAPFERLLLDEIFDSDTRDGAVHYYASEFPSDFLTLNRHAVENALSGCHMRSRVRSALLEDFLNSDPEHDYFGFELATVSDYTVILQDIVRRSKAELPYLTVAAAFTCSELRSNAVGGMAIIITPSRISYRCTDAFFGRFEERWARKVGHRQKEVIQ